MDFSNLNLSETNNSLSESNNDGPFYGTTSDAFDVRYGDDSHQTFGQQFGKGE